jgi:alpha-L-fucosidase
LQPNAVIAIMGPDVRWVGTESGYGRETEWSVLPVHNLNVDQIAANSQQQPVDGTFMPGDLTAEDLGSREKIKNATALIWYPAETDVSIRPGWFYHQSEDTRVKTPEKLVDIYYSSVGRNALLLLNLPPDTRGLIHENDIQALKGMRQILNETFKTTLAEPAQVMASSETAENPAHLVLDPQENKYWTTAAGVDSASLEFQFPQPITFDRAQLQENIRVGQRIEKFYLAYHDGQKWLPFANGTTVGYKRLLRFPVITAQKMKLVIEQSRAHPTLSYFGLFKAPPEIQFEPEGGAFVDRIQVRFTETSTPTSIYYTLDGSLPNLNSKRYSQPLLLTASTTISAFAVAADGKQSLPVTAYFNKARFGMILKSKFDPRYSGGGALALIDGVGGSLDFDDGKWQGYEGVDLEVVLDLGKVKHLSRIATRFLQDLNRWIFFPMAVEYSIATDDQNFNVLTTVENQIHDRDDQPKIQVFEVPVQHVSARFIRILARNIGICPVWHKGAGGKAWLFTDEILMEAE